MLIASPRTGASRIDKIKDLHGRKTLSSVKILTPVKPSKTKEIAVKIERDAVAENEIFDRLRESITSEERTGIHLSDLLYPRKRYWGEIRPLPPTNDEIMYWLTGKGHETVFIRVGKFKPGVPTEWNGIVYTTDVYEGYPVEIKTRRGWVAKDGEESDRYSNYIEQLRGYCACSNNTKGHLIVWALTQGGDDRSKATKPIMQVYRVDFSHRELTDERLRLLDRRDKLRLALSKILTLAGNVTYPKEAHKDLPPCPDWMCGVSRKNAPVCSCGKQFATVPGYKKHIASVGETDHTLIESFRVEMKCPYLPECRGDEDRWKGAIPPEGNEDA